MEELLSQILGSAGGGLVGAAVILINQNTKIAVMNTKIDTLFKELRILRGLEK